VGKQADLFAIKMDSLEQQPLYNPISQLVYASDRSQITDLWVAGKHLMKERELTTLNKQSILANVKQWQHKIKQQDSLI
jgi:5-methylthioadenosine/S-adenosylhomocysteine deaminase